MGRRQEAGGRRSCRKKEGRGGREESKKPTKEINNHMYGTCVFQIFAGLEHCFPARMKSKRARCTDTEKEASHLHICAITQTMLLFICLAVRWFLF